MGDDCYSDDDGDVDECVLCLYVGFQWRYGFFLWLGLGGGCVFSNIFIFLCWVRKFLFWICQSY